MYGLLKDKNVLYIEDELDVLENISTILKQFFNEFYALSNAEDALDVFYDNHIDLLIVDIELPMMSGIEFIKQIRKTHKDIPIIIISAYTKTDYLLESIELKLEQYIVKPFTTQKIYSMLDYLNHLYMDEDAVEIVDGVVFSKQQSTISFDNQTYHLTPKEFKILDILSQTKAISYDELSALWEDEVPSQNAIRSCIKQLRKKLPEGFLQNHSGFGYIINETYKN
jgi:DNA-binding response OmpR family regulator